MRANGRRAKRTQPMATGMVALVALVAVMLVVAVVYIMRRLANVERTTKRTAREVRHQITPDDLNEAFGQWVTANPGAVTTVCAPYINRSVAVAANAMRVQALPPPPHNYPQQQQQQQRAAVPPQHPAYYSAPHPSYGPRVSHGQAPAPASHVPAAGAAVREVRQEEQAVPQQQPQQPSHAMPLMHANVPVAPHASAPAAPHPPQQAPALDHAVPGAQRHIDAALPPPPANAARQRPPNMRCEGDVCVVMQDSDLDRCVQTTLETLSSHESDADLYDGSDDDDDDQEGDERDQGEEEEDDVQQQSMAAPHEHVPGAGSPVEGGVTREAPVPYEDDDDDDDDYDDGGEPARDAANVGPSNADQATFDPWAVHDEIHAYKQDGDDDDDDDEEEEDFDEDEGQHAQDRAAGEWAKHGEHGLDGGDVSDDDEAALGLPPSDMISMHAPLLLVLSAPDHFSYQTPLPSARITEIDDDDDESDTEDEPESPSTDETADDGSGACQDTSHDAPVLSVDPDKLDGGNGDSVKHDSNDKDEEQESQKDASETPADVAEDNASVLHEGDDVDTGASPVAPSDGDSNHESAKSVEAKDQSEDPADGDDDDDGGGDDGVAS